MGIDAYRNGFNSDMHNLTGGGAPIIEEPMNEDGDSTPKIKPDDEKPGGGRD
jgi:hypothetical protein